jgi:hypothetical protein
VAEGHHKADRRNSTVQHVFEEMEYLPKFCFTLSYKHFIDRAIGYKESNSQEINKMLQFE